MKILTVLVTAAMLLGAMAGAEPVKQTAGVKPGDNKVATPVTKKVSPLTIDLVPTSAVRSSERKLFEKNRVHARKAEALLRAGGVTNEKAIIAILANAWHESKWNPAVAGGPNIGFFQLNHSGGMGRGHRVSQLKKLDYNVKVMMASTSFKEWVAWVKKNPNQTAGEMAYRFAQKVERCAVKHRAPRRTTGNAWYTGLVKNKGSTKTG